MAFVQPTYVLAQFLPKKIFKAGHSVGSNWPTASALVVHLLIVLKYGFLLVLFFYPHLSE